ncbi:hypothetical protein HID58_081726 [Brassica napus]|uniref:CCHC-type domain-containing protein n=1 Tax=Brassica napus TaxID=3708 RepID=A0ABQ7Y8I4_BRANA|nr:hypothetical protein HID58_081726 [Brassica napus]
MARLQGALKPSTSVRSLQQSSLAGASSADAVIAASVAPTTEVSPSTPEVSVDLSLGHLPLPLAPVLEFGNSSPLTPCELDVTPTVSEEVTPDATIEVSLPIQEVVSRDIPHGALQKAATLGEYSGTKSYASLVKDSATLEELGTPSEHVSGVPFVLIPDENIESAKEEFRDYIFARFHGDWPSMGRIIGVVNAVWAKTGPRIFVHMVGAGEYLLKVTSAKTREHLLSRTCWNIAGFPMFVAPWSHDFTPEEAPITSAVVPVELRGVPYLLFNKESLSRLATAVGKPVSLAPETERKENFQVAKLFVRVDLTRELPSKMISGFSNGKENEITISYPWLPLKCNACGKYGHLNTKCRALPRSNTEGRRRSPSPTNEEDKGRKQSRQGRRRRGGKAGTHNKERSVDGDAKKGVTSSQGLEDGEIPPEEHTEDTTVTTPVRENGIPESSDKTVPPDISIQKFPPAHDLITSSYESGPSSGVPSAEADGSDEHEAPFLLVNRQSCGRRERNSQRINNALPIGWSFFGNYDHHLSGRIIVVWDPSVRVFIYKSSAQVVTCGIYLMAENVNFTVSFVYGFNTVLERKNLWEEMVYIHDSTPVVNSPWSVLGDFNQIFRLSQHSDYPLSVIDPSGIDDMVAALQDSELFECQAKGLPFTWWNNSGSNPVSKRIDHALINHSWAASFPDSYADFLQPDQSDHAPCLLRVPSISRRIRKPFKFYHHLTGHPDYSSVVSDAWSNAEVQGSEQFKLVRRMKLLKTDLRNLNKTHFSGITGRVKQQSVRVANLQQSLLTCPDPVTASEEHRQRDILNTLLNAEQKFFRQRSRVRWADVGDRNTPFFHKTVAQRNNSNHIHYLIDESGQFLGSIDDINAHSVSYFQDILGHTDLPVSPVPLNALEDLLSFRCSDLQKAYLKRDGKEANEINNILRRSPRSEEAVVWRWQKKLQVVVEVEPRKKKKKIGGEGEKTETRGGGGEGEKTETRELGRHSNGGGRRRQMEEEDDGMYTALWGTVHGGVD